MLQHIHFESQWLLQHFFGPHKVAQITSVAQCRNIPILSRNGYYKNFFWVGQSRANNFGRTMLQHIHFESQWSQQTFFWPHKVAQITSIAQCRNKLKKITLFFVKTFEKCLKTSFCLLFQKFATYFFSVAQNCNLSPLVHARSHKNSSVAQICENSVFSFNGRSIPFLSRAISPKNKSIAQNCNVPMIRIITDLIRDSATYPEFQRSQHSWFGLGW